MPWQKALLEQDINQKEMGAYYTPAAVTAYITRNTLLPALFTRAGERCGETGAPGRIICQQVAQQPARYIFAAARKGYELALPPEISAGLLDVTQRQLWQRTAPEPYALPGETWREVIARRMHLDDISARLSEDDPDKLHRLVTWNLDQEQLTLNTLQDCQQPEFLEAFYQSLRRLTILDPTCGTGAFLFAALAQLEPLYKTCLTRMEGLLSAANTFSNVYLCAFRNHLEEAGDPAQRQYTILRWIIEHNLYGVDIMEEAVETCRHRLFLKVLAALPNHHAARLPPDFGQHICVGNSLVGSLHTGQGEHAEKQAPIDALDQRAFHWSLAFPEVMRRGGFDVVIGNPPYVEYERIRQMYTVDGYATLETGNLYALTMERSSHLLAPGGRFGMIVPSSATCTDGYRSLQKLLLAQQELHIASFSDQRGRLFAIPHPRLCIIFYEKAAPSQARPGRVFATPYIKLGRVLHASLFDRLSYTEVTHQVRPGVIPRYGSPLEQAIHLKLYCQARQLGEYLHPTGEYKVYYTRKLSWFVQVTPFVPLILDDQGNTRTPSELKSLRFASPIYARIAFVALNSNLFYWLITTSSDCRNLNMREVRGLPLDLASIQPALQQELCKLSLELENDLQANSALRVMNFKSQGRLNIQCMYPARSKWLIDEIDRLLAWHYDFTAEELDFLLHYDDQYRQSGQITARASKRGLTG